MRDKLDEGLTLLLVSHDPSAVRALCQRGLVLNRGRLAYLGRSDRAVNVYHELGDRRNEEPVTATETLPQEEKSEGIPPAEIKPALELSPLGQISDEIGSREILITGCGLFDHLGQPCRAFAVGESILVGISFRSQFDVDSVMAGFVVRDRFNNPVTGASTVNQRLDSPPISRGRTYTVTLMLPGRLGPGEYLLDFGIGGLPDIVGSPQHHYHRVGGIASFSVAWHDRMVRFKGMCDLGAEFRWLDR